MGDENAKALRSDDSLLKIVREILLQEGYEVSSTECPGTSLRVVVAENRLFATAIAALPTVESLAVAEDHVVRLVVSALHAHQGSPKRWDAYAVLLTQQPTEDDPAATRDLFSISYDTNAVRRVVHAGVQPTEESVRRALSPFLSPLSLADSDLDRDPLQLLVDELDRSGDSSLIRAAVRAHKDGKEVADVL